jgi:hypothetical protein
MSFAVAEVHCGVLVLESALLGEVSATAGVTYVGDFFAGSCDVSGIDGMAFEASTGFGE